MSHIAAASYVGAACLLSPGRRELPCAVPLDARSSSERLDWRMGPAPGCARVAGSHGLPSPASEADASVVIASIGPQPRPATSPSEWDSLCRPNLSQNLWGG